MKHFKNLIELENFYKSFENKSLKNIIEYVNNKYPNITLSTNKGIPGQILEAVTGRPPNSDPEPDIKNLGIELKVLPLRKISNKLQPKERSKIKSINYNEIVDEVWETTEVKKKMEKILFLLYEHPSGKGVKDWKEFLFKGTLFYELKNENENIVQKDWEGIKYKVKSEIADKLSEGDGERLGACTSGTGKLVNYGNNKKAKQRSYSLKHSYIKVFYSQNKKKENYSSLNLEKNLKPEEYALSELNKQLNGQNLNYLVNKYDVKFSSKAKSAFSLLVNRILKIDDKKKILELEQKGISIKTIPVNSNNKPWQAMSFPKFSLVDLIEEEWDGENEAVFKNMISEGFIFIPIIKEKKNYISKGKKKERYKNWRTWEVGKSIYWKASHSELSIIKKEWKKAKSIVNNGIKVNQVKYGNGIRQENNLLKSSESRIIHMRPHAKNSKDIDKPYFEYSQNKIKISWQSFWLNKKFTEKILNQKGADENPAP